MKRNLSLLIAIIFMICSLLPAETLKDHIDALLKDAPDPGKTGLTKTLPYKVVDAKLGFFGVFALLKFENKSRLGIFNIAQGKFQKMLKLKSTNFKFATGSSVLLVFYPDIKVIELWNLKTMKKVKTKKITIDSGFLSFFEMAPALKTKVFVSGGEGGNADKRFYGILNLKTFKLTKFKEDSLFKDNEYSDRIHIRCNHNMTKVLAWSTSGSPSGFNYVVLSNTPPTFKYKHYSSGGALNFSNNDNLVLTACGTIINKVGRVLKRYSHSMLFPVLGDDFYIQYKKWVEEGESNLIIRELNTHKKITELTTEVELEDTAFADSDFTIDRKIMASRTSGRVFIIDNDNLKLRIYPLGISGKSNSFGRVPKAFVGQKWICKLKYPKGTNVVIEDGPENMTFNASSNKLIWDKPKTQGIQDVLLSISKPNGDEFYKEIEITVKNK